MGLLDEAIREHLELKRRSGADPSEVAREEREALSSVSSENGTDAEGQRELPDDAATGEQVTETHVVPSDELQQADVLGAEPSTVGQETAELDMQVVMGDGARDLPPAAANLHDVHAAAGPVPAAYSPEPPSDGSVDGEAPIEAEDAHPGDAAGQTRLSLE